MARDGAGNYSNPYPDFVAGTTIESAQVDANNADIAAALTASLAKDGQTVPTANLPMGGFKHTGVAVASSRTDYARADQVIGSVLDYAADTGTATAYAIAPSPGISAYVVGQRFAFKAANANSGADPTLAVNSLTAGIIYWPNGASLIAGEIPANAQIIVQVATVTTGTPTFHLQSCTKPALPRTGGTLTGTLAMSGAAINEAVRVDVASASTCNIGAAASNYVRITGTTGITAFDTVASGIKRSVVFADALTITHNGTSLILKGAANITTVAGDTAEFVSEGSGNWRCLDYRRASAVPFAPTLLTNSLGADVTCDNTGNYFDGPSVAQGTTGTWFASGTVTVGGAGIAAGDVFNIKLWDGTTVIASTEVTYEGASGSQSKSASLSGYLASPAGNIRISVNSATRTNLILFNASGNSKDSTISAFRIA